MVQVEAVVVMEGAVVVVEATNSFTLTPINRELNLLMRLVSSPRLGGKVVLTLKRYGIAGRLVEKHPIRI